jgi:hypothetical protein
LRARLWRLEEGPEWPKSLREADPHDEYFEDNLATARIALELDPFTYSRGLMKENDDVRIFTTKDPAAGYRVIIGIRIQSRVVTLGWVEVEPLDDTG